MMARRNRKLTTATSTASWTKHLAIASVLSKESTENQLRTKYSNSNTVHVADAEDYARKTERSPQTTFKTKHSFAKPEAK